MKDKGRNTSSNNHKYFHHIMRLCIFKIPKQFEILINCEIIVFISEEPVKIDLTVDEFNSVSVR